MNQKYPIKAFDGTNTADVSVLNLPAGSVGANGEIDLGVGVKVYRALLTQTGTDDPVATVLENTLGGEVVWTYRDAGLYAGTREGAFTASKTWLPPVNASQTLDGAASFVETSFFRHNADEVRLQTAQIDAGLGTQTLNNNLLNNAYVEILVYP